MWSQRDTPAMGPPKNQKGVRLWTGTRLIELESHELICGEEADAVAALRGVSSKTAAYLLAQLRATPRSRLVARAAGPQFARR